MKREISKENFKINLVKEVYQKTNLFGGSYPYREYEIDDGEKYQLIIDDKISGNSGGSLRIKLNIVKKDKIINVYSYIYNGQRKKAETFEYKNPKYEILVEVLEKRGYIKKINSKKEEY